ncbi:MAG TPA: PQQ-binding-like beta-propeller repeat protein, partial [Armatimonadota bacterium]|nr:PQQ-binding-like beta-propeller repeat protein [Armatimonadota bacterium]
MHSGQSPYHDPLPTDELKVPVSGSPLSSCAIGPAGTVYVGAGTNLYSISSTGTVNWMYPIGGTRSTPAIAADGTIYIGSSDDRLYAVNSNGTFKWSYTTGGDITSSPAIGADGTVYFGSMDGYLYALNPDGTLKWSLVLSSISMSSPAIADDGTIYVCAAGLRAVNPNGTQKWHYNPGGTTLTSPAISPDGSRIYFGSSTNFLYSVDTGGNMVWRFPIEYYASNTPSSPAVASDGTIYVGSNFGTLHCIHPSGTENWRYETWSDIRSSPALNADGTIFFGAWNGGLYALNPDGTVKWWYFAPASIYSSPAIDASGGIWIGVWDSCVYGNLNHSPPSTNPPSNLTITLTADDSVRLDWADNSTDEYGFKIHRKQAGGTYAIVGSVGAGVTTWSDSGLLEGETYYYQVSAFQEGGYAYSNEVQVTMPGLLAPKSLTAIQSPGVGIQLTWSGDTPIETGYWIERKAGNLGLFREIATVGADVMSFTDSTVNPAADYYYRVQAFDGSIASDYSNEAWCVSEGREYGDISLVPTTRKQMALTFDAGEPPLNGVLDTLRQYNVRCTFFVTGTVAQVTPEYWVQATIDGHQVCNHSYNHPDLRSLTDDEIRWQLTAADDIIYSVTGNHSRPLFRAPSALRDARVLAAAASAGFRHVYWSSWPGDTDVSQIVSSTLSAACNGAVILLHASKPDVETALQTIVPTLLSQGYELVTVSELVAPLQITSPTEAIFGSKSLMSVPIEPAHPAPLQVFRGAPIDGYLIQWDNESQ